MNVTVPVVKLPEEPRKASSEPEPENGQEVYQLWDKRDEAQIVEALKGRYLEEFVYEYCRRHKWIDGQRPAECRCADVVVGLSWVGIQEASREYQGIQVPIEKSRKQESEEAVEVMVEAVDSKTGSSRIGVATQNKKIRLKTGQVIDDEFAVQKAMAKAQRNALKLLLPVTLLKAWIKKHQGEAIPAARVPVESRAEPAVVIPAQAAVKPSNGTNGHSNGYGWRPSVPQVKRIFGIAFGHGVAKEEVLAVIGRIAGVKDPADISSKQSYEDVCAQLEKYRDGLPF